MAEYTPSEEHMEVAWIEYDDAAPDINEAAADFDRFLARVRRDAAREALGGLADHSDSRDGDGVKGRLGGIIRIWRDTHYPETEDQT